MTFAGSRAVVLAASVLLQVAPVSAARQPRTIRVRFPRVEVPPGVSRELCAFVRIPTTADYDLKSFKIVHRTRKRGLVVEHFLVYAYEGEHLAAFRDVEGRVVPSRGCLDFGPADRDHRQLIAAGTATVSDGTLPAGIARVVRAVPETPGGAPAGIGLVLAGDWANSGTKPERPRVRVTLRRAKRKSVRRRALPIFERSAEAALAVSPFTVGTALGEWGPGIPAVGDPGPAGTACVRVLSGHFHERGRYFAIDRVGASGLVDTPSTDSPPNVYVPGAAYLFGALDFTDPSARTFRDPLLVGAGARLRYTCWVDNGVETPVRLGCEETIGVAPGDPVAGPAKPCTVVGPASPDCPASDPAHPGRTFTGACVEANAVAGGSPDDEACQLVGAYWDAVPGAAPGRECDVSALPPVN